MFTLVQWSDKDTKTSWLRVHSNLHDHHLTVNDWSVVRQSSDSYKIIAWWSCDLFSTIPKFQIWKTSMNCFVVDVRVLSNRCLHFFVENPPLNQSSKTWNSPLDLWANPIFWHKATLTLGSTMKRVWMTYQLKTKQFCSGDHTMLRSVAKLN